MKLRALLLLALALFIGIALTGTVLALVGDLDISGTVDKADMTIVTNAYGSRRSPPSPNWDWRADINQDTYVDLSDLTIAGRNYGDTFNFHWPRRVDNLGGGHSVDAAVDSRGHVHLLFQRYLDNASPFYYTQLDPAGNTVVDDVRISGDAANPRLAVDAQDNVHIVYYQGGQFSGRRYTRLDAQGRTVIAPRRFPSQGPEMPGSNLAVAVDGYGHPHLLYGSYTGLLYAILDSSGNELISGVRLDTTATGVSDAALAVDRFGSRHVLWHGTGNNLFYTRIISGGLPAPNQIAVTHFTADWNGRLLVIRADSQGAAHVLWGDNRGDGGAIYWRRINSDGTLTAERRVAPGDNFEPVDFTIDGSDQIHLVAEDDGKGHYARLDRDGNVLIPFRTVAYSDPNPHYLRIVVGPDGTASLITTNFDASVFVMSTLPDVAANDTTRADLMLDPAKLTARPNVARITQDTTITATVANAGWVTASNVVVSFTETVSDTPIAPVVIASLPPFSSTTIARTFNLPDLEYTPLLPIRVSVASDTPETTLSNNAVTVTLGVVLPAHAVDMQLAAMDETYAPDDRSQAWGLYGGTLTLDAPTVGYHRVITASEMIGNLLGVPLDASQGSAMTTAMVATLSAPGYSTATQAVTATRLITDPYRVIITPAAPVPLYVNRWGEAHGTTYAGATGATPLPGVTVTLDSGRTAVSDANGTFIFSKVVSGTHTLEGLHAGYEPTELHFSVHTGETAMPFLHMPPTTKGIVRGTVLNDLGRPYGGARVEVYGAGSSTPLGTATTSEDGTYRLEIADAGAHASYQMRGSHTAAEPYTSGWFVVTAGIPYTHDFWLQWTQSTNNAQAHGEIASWVQQESWNSLEIDDIPVGEIIGAIGEGICAIVGADCEGPESYEVKVLWGEYFYDLGMAEVEAGGNHTLQWLSTGFENGRFYVYNVTGGDYTLGGPLQFDKNPPFAHYDGPRTLLRVDRVELVELDSAGNVAAIHWPTSGESFPWYTNAEEGTGGVRDYGVGVSLTSGQWSRAAVRIYLRVGQYASGENQDWKTWHPPIPVASLNGSGSGAGADYQRLTWKLTSNEVSIDYAVADYPNPGAQVAMNAVPYGASPVGMTLRQAPVTLAPVAPQAGEIVSLTFPIAPPAVVGQPFEVDVSVSGATSRPVYGVEFDLRFNRSYLQLISVKGAADFDGPYGTWVEITPTRQIINASGRLTDTAVVRLGAERGITQGNLVRIGFMPVSPVASTSLDLSGVRLADEEGTQYLPSSTRDATLSIRGSRVFYLPLVLRGSP